MAIAYLNEGATSLASANWDDATGFADNATLIIDKPFGNGGPVTSGVDQSGLSTGIDYLDIMKGANGTIGSGAAPLRVDADTAAGDGITNYGDVTLHFRGGGSGVINNFSCGPGSQNYHTEDTIGQVVVEGGIFESEEAGVITNFDAYGGSGELKYNATKITTARIMRGSWILRRGYTNLIVGERARVIIDLDDAADTSSMTITNYGGYLNLINATTPTMVSIGGEIELRNARRPFTLGGTAFTLGGTRINEGSGTVTLSNVTNVGNSKRNVGDYQPAP